ncbi:MAG TPA: hypothetical protein VE734_10485 [Terriglobales bacterium]|nr:hypothetical protein [Terriglobales bacterium]
MEKCKTRLDHVLVEFCLTGYALVGGRVAYLEHEPGAHLLYDVDAHHISVFIFRNRPQDRTYISYTRLHSSRALFQSRVVDV